MHPNWHGACSSSRWWWGASEERAPFPRPGWLPLPSHALCEEPARALCLPRRTRPKAQDRRPHKPHEPVDAIHCRSMGARKSARQRLGTKSIPAILPQPKRVSRGRGQFRIPDGMPIVLPARKGTLDRRLLVAAEQASRDLFARTGLEIRIERPRTHDPEHPSIRCRIDRSAAISPRAKTARDAYRLDVGKFGVEISAPTSHGIRYGLQTLCQLVSRSGRIPLLKIVDQPDFRDRGILLDVSRGKVPTRATLFDLVDLCSRLRLNVLMLYIEHSFDFRRHPEIGRDASPLDAQTILALDAYAADRGVELIPCLQSLGHMERLLSLDRYAHLAESDRRWSISPNHPETQPLLEQLYDEFLPLFRSSRFNANCDEPFDLGRGQSARRQPHKSPGALFTDHVNRLERLARSHDKRLMIWADFAHKHPDSLSRLNPNVVLLDWWYEAAFDADRIRKLRSKGFDSWVCPGTSSWNCLFPRTKNSQENIARWAEAGRRHLASGLLNTDWGDFGHYNALGVSLHSYAWGAQQAWSGETEAARFDRAFARQVFAEDTGRLGRLYRKLGVIHDAGFEIANGSALQFLYFDPLGSSYFLQHAKHKALERSADRLEKVSADIEAAELVGADDDFAGLARQEIAWAAEATGLAIEKGLAALDYNGWREEPRRLTSPARRRLANRLTNLAKEQSSQLQRFETLWLARSEVSDLALIRRRIRRSIAAVREAARRLRKNRPPRPPRPSKLDLFSVYNELRREMGMPPL